MAAPDAREAEHKYLAVQQFGSLNSQPSRTALEQNEFAWIENFMPIGDAYAPAVPGPGAPIASLNPSQAVAISASAPGTEFWQGAGTATVSAATETIVAGQFFGTWAGLAGMRDAAGGQSLSLIITELAFYNGATRADTAAIDIESPSDIPDFGVLANLNDGNLTDASLCGWVSSLGYYLNTHFAVGYKFTSPPILTAVAMAGRSGGDGILNCPDGADIVQSVDGTYWVVVDPGLTGLRAGAPNVFGSTITFSTITSPGTDRYWRVTAWDTFNYPSTATRNLRLSSFALYDGIVDKTSLATASTTMTFVAGTLAELFDGNPTSVVEFSGAGLSYIDFDFGGSPQSINGVRSGASDDADKWCWQFEVHRSGDAVTWTFVGKLAVNTFPGNFTVTPIVRLY